MDAGLHLGPDHRRGDHQPLTPSPRPPLHREGGDRGRPGGQGGDRPGSRGHPLTAAEAEVHREQVPEERDRRRRDPQRFRRPEGGRGAGVQHLRQRDGQRNRQGALQEVAMRRADIDRARFNVSVFDTQIGDTKVYSPADGVVMVRAAEPGEVIAAGTSVLTIGDIEHPWLRGYISEQQLGRVKLGQKVILRTDSYPGKEYEGRVSFIASDAEFTPKQIQTQEERVKLVYRVKIDVDNKHRELKNNMPVDAEINLGN